MKTAFRTDRATMRKPEVTPQGFLRVDGVIGRVGIYEYRNDDGSIRYELRPEDEVGSPEALASADAASMTDDHPTEEVNAENVRRHEVGAVTGPARMDGREAVASMVIKDARIIKKVRAGKQQLSPGYRIRLDETPGADARHGYPGNPAGRWDAVQRDIRVNHVAIVDRARGGPSVRLRMDSADRADADGVRLTAIAAGHQHMLELRDYQGMLRTSGCTTWTMSEGGEQAHSHDWVRNTDGSITVALADGHSHSLLDDAEVTAARSDGQFDQSTARLESGRMATPPMDQDEQIRSLKAQLADAVAKLGPTEETAKRHAARADSAEAKLESATKEISDLQAQIAAAATFHETEAIKREKFRADAAEEQIRRFDEVVAQRVSARVALERKVCEVMGAEFRCDGVDERQLLAVVVKRLDAQADTSPAVSDAHLSGRFEAELARWRRTARSNQNVGALIAETQQKRTDALEERRAALRNQGLEPLPNDPRARKGA